MACFQLIAMTTAILLPRLGSRWHLVNQLKSCRALWLLVILLVLLPNPHLLTDPHVGLNILGIQLINISIVGWLVDV